MGTRKYIVLYIIGAFLTLISLNISAQEEEWRPRPIMWTHSEHRSTGLYTTANDFIQEGISFGADVLYYSGDHDMTNGVPIFSGFNEKAMSASVNAAYHQPLSTHFAMRYTLSLGVLQGNNKHPNASNPSREFLSIFAQPAVGVECYPINHYGLMLYAGIAAPIGFLAKYKYQDADSKPKCTFAPAAQLGIGYSWIIDRRWMITVDLSGTYALMEFNNNNVIGLDGIGKGTGYVTGQYTGKPTKFTEHDGYFQLGISATYRFSECLQCRILNNYGRVKTNNRKR